MGGPWWQGETLNMDLCWSENGLQHFYYLWTSSYRFKFKRWTLFVNHLYLQIGKKRKVSMTQVWTLKLSITHCGPLDFSAIVLLFKSGTNYTYHWHGIRAEFLYHIGIIYLWFHSLSEHINQRRFCCPWQVCRHTATVNSKASIFWVRNSNYVKVVLYKIVQ